jgi:2,3-diketo-5-methylthio-1-phosphopentane phosphatase
VADRTIVVDFDGTITEQDILDAVSQTFGDPEVFREVDEALDRDELTLQEVIRREFEPVQAPLEEVVDWVVANARIRPGFAEFVELAREEGWRVVVLSSGFRELIEPIFEREGIVGLELVSNTVSPQPTGWVVQFHDETSCDRCGQPCKRTTLARIVDGGEVVYVGDGYSDRCAADDADLVFAANGRGLQGYLAERGIPFEPFDDFHEVAGRLER